MSPTPVTQPQSQPADEPLAGGPAADSKPVLVRGSADLVAAIPHLVGFPPERSLVVVCMHRHERRSRLGLVARFDLPAEDRRRRRTRDCSTSAAAAMAHDVLAVVLRDSPDEVVALVYDDAPGADAPPWRHLVDALDDAFRAAEVPVMDTLFVGASSFRSYRCDDPSCCPAEGRPLDHAASPVAAELTARGSAPLPSRAALHDLVRPHDETRCTAVEAAARGELRAISRAWGEEQNPRWRAWQLATLRLMDDVAGRYLAGRGGVTEEEAGRLVAGLCDISVRDAAAVLFTHWSPGQDGPEEPPSRMAELVTELVAELGAPAGAERGGVARSTARLPERDHRLELLWRDLATACDGPLAVAPLTSLGMHVWSQGKGALALAAVQRALSLDPAYRLAVLLDRALSAGVRPGS